MFYEENMGSNVENSVKVNYSHTKVLSWYSNSMQ